MFTKTTLRCRATFQPHVPIKMFTRLLDSARAEARQQVSTPIKSSKNNSAAPAAAPEELSNDDLCDLFSEFLFDIFDANCMEEFKQIEALEMSHSQCLQTG